MPRSCLRHSMLRSRPFDFLGRSRGAHGMFRVDVRGYFERPANASTGPEWRNPDGVFRHSESSRRQGNSCADGFWSPVTQAGSWRLQSGQPAFKLVSRRSHLGASRRPPLPIRRSASPAPTAPPSSLADLQRSPRNRANQSGLPAHQRDEGDRDARGDRFRRLP
jgi:hypothetical protein